MESITSFGYWLRRRRKALDLTQDALARQAGCALGTLKKIETDERRPSHQLAERLADCLAVPVAERAAFLKAARGVLATDQLAVLTQPIDQQNADTAPPDSPTGPHNLPAQPTALIGREREIATVTALLRRDEVRLLTLTGPGGTGKTRLALQSAAELFAGFPDGIWFVNLAPISDPKLVATTLAHTLGVVESARQQTLRNTIDWSYNLLDEAAGTLFARLGVFAGGWTIEAAEAVCRDQGAEVGYLESGTQSHNPPAPIFDLLAALVDQNLVRQVETADGAARFTMLETIREYARERLEESREAAMLRRRHAAYYLALSEQASPELVGSEQAVWLNRLEQEIDNLRAVFAWSLAAPDIADVAIHVAVALEPFWSIRGHENELQTWLSRTLAMSRHLTKQARATALRMAADLESTWGDSTQARKLSDEAVALYRELGDQADLAWALVFAGRIARNRGDYAHAAILEEEALRLFQEQKMPRESIWALLSLGDVALDQGDVMGAAHRFQHARTLAQEQENTWAMGWALICLGRTSYAQNDNIQAQALIEQGMALFRNLGEQSGMAMALFELGRIVHRQGDATRAAALFAEALLPLQRTGAWRDLTYALAGLAEIAGEHRQPARAARLLGAVEALREAIGHPLPPIMRVEYDSAVTATRAQLDDATFTAARAAGSLLTLEQAIAEALAVSTIGNDDPRV